MNFGDRLYSQNTAASSRKRSSTANTRVLEEAWSSHRGGAPTGSGGGAAAIDVRSEVDRMYENIMNSIERMDEDDNGGRGLRLPHAARRLSSMRKQIRALPPCRRSSARSASRCTETRRSRPSGRVERECPTPSRRNLTNPDRATITAMSTLHTPAVD